MNKLAEPSLNAQLPETHEDIQQMYSSTKNTPKSDGYFWDGFNKAAAARVNLGMKSLRSYGGAPGLKPTSGVATAAAFKPNQLPLPKPVAANRNLDAAVLKPQAKHQVHHTGRLNI
ncbi:MAG: hypothetical protein EB078_11240 [Proteobacteria bacterium]|nr:hypothetical protein [Pseudomonadota bacterium]NDD05472.1 hypothetical protein [Pseudomonadota bacterium]